MKQRILVILTVLACSFISCEKDSYDYRDNYLGTFEFTSYFKSYSNMFPSTATHYDTIVEVGIIRAFSPDDTHGNGFSDDSYVSDIDFDTEITIEYGFGHITATLAEDGTIEERRIHATIQRGQFDDFDHLNFTISETRLTSSYHKRVVGVRID